jgi:hypothetical protein
MSDESAPEEESFFPFETDLLVKLFFLVVLVWGIYLALQIPTWDRRPDKIYPRLLVSGLLLLSAIQLVKMQFPGIADRIKPSTDEDSDAQELRENLNSSRDGSGRSRPERHKYELILSGWATALPILVYLFGFLYILPVYVFALTYYMERSLKKALLTTGIFSAFGYVIFLRLLNVPLWNGIVFGGGVG